ncbi:MAG: 6,7-dimethyl-8-ribityllumazine synthase [Chitinispirillales bacterium]|jgi:6,7-dimethyl-8-ribityllumazine synthase|nr:6,7-dimethyl-8-ribityllumazine synthase [Chitinispirillales bacterium]
MPTVVQGVFSGSGKKFGIVAGRFNELITGKLLEGAYDCLERHGVSLNDVTVCWVPGSFEIPVAAQRMARAKKFDAIICLGTVIRGSTPHFDYVASEVSKGVAAVSLAESLPVIFGVLTTDSIEQAVERAGTKAGNKGWDAALSALEMSDLFTKI